MTRPDILFENEELIALNKPSGVLSIPDRKGEEASVKTWLQEKYGQIFTVHRIDRDTSGLILFAKNESMHKYLSEAFTNRTVEKFYLGVVQGEPVHHKKTIDAPIMEHPTRKGYMIVSKRGKTSITDYEVVETFGKFTLVSFQIHTGRTHQIRVHMKNEGHAILCDELYGDATPILLSTFKKKFKLSKDLLEERPLLSRLALHAHKLRIPMPDGSLLELEAPLQKDMKVFLQQMKKHG